MKSGTEQFFLDCSEYDCPMMLAQLKEALGRVAPGQTVEVITNCAEKFQFILRAWTHETNDTYCGFLEKGERTHHFIQKAPDHERREHKPHPHIITNEELKKILSVKGNFRLVDVREDIEYMLGHVPEAINVPLSDFTSRISLLPKDETYYMICRTGNRSDFACKYMTFLGFKNVYNVMPGMCQWDGEVV
mgnify:CR=1 FL=1